MRSRHCRWCCPPGHTRPRLPTCPPGQNRVRVGTTQAPTAGCMHARCGGGAPLAHAGDKLRSRQPQLGSAGRMVRPYDDAPVRSVHRLGCLRHGGESKQLQQSTQQRPDHTAVCFAPTWTCGRNKQLAVAGSGRETKTGCRCSALSKSCRTLGSSAVRRAAVYAARGASSSYSTGVDAGNSSGSTRAKSQGTHRLSASTRRHRPLPTHPHPTPRLNTAPLALLRHRHRRPPPCPLCSRTKVRQRGVRGSQQLSGVASAGEADGCLPRPQHPARRPAGTALCLQMPGGRGAETHTPSGSTHDAALPRLAACKSAHPPDPAPARTPAPGAAQTQRQPRRRAPHGS
jgi:hypothetical protein